MWELDERFVAICRGICQVVTASEDRLLSRYLDHEDPYIICAPKALLPSGRNYGCITKASWPSGLDIKYTTEMRESCRTRI